MYIPLYSWCTLGAFCTNRHYMQPLARNDVTPLNTSERESRTYLTRILFSPQYSGQGAISTVPYSTLPCLSTSDGLSFHWNPKWLIKKHFIYYSSEEQPINSTHFNMGNGSRVNNRQRGAAGVCYFIKLFMSYGKLVNNHKNSNYSLLTKKKKKMNALHVLRKRCSPTNFSSAFWLFWQEKKEFMSS